MIDVIDVRHQKSRMVSLFHNLLFLIVTLIVEKDIKFRNQGAFILVWSKNKGPGPSPGPSPGSSTEKYPTTKLN